MPSFSFARASLGLALIAIPAACGGGDAGAEGICQPRETRQCFDTAGCSGIQYCNFEGTDWGPCKCGASSSSSSSTGPFDTTGPSDPTDPSSDPTTSGETFWVCGSQSDIGFFSICTSGECDSASWPEAGPYSSSDACTADRSRVSDYIAENGHAGGARFGSDETNVSGRLVWRSTGSEPDIDTALIGSIASVYPDGFGMVVAAGPDGTTGSVTGPGPGWLVVAIAEGQTPESVSCVPLTPGYEYPQSEDLSPGEVRIFYDTTSHDVSCDAMTLTDVTIDRGSSTATFELGLDGSGMTLTDDMGNTYLGEGTLYISGTTALNPLQDGDGGSFSSTGGSSTDALASCLDTTTGVCVELDASNSSSQETAFETACGADGTYSTLPCSGTWSAYCTGAQGTSAGTTTNISVYWPTNFCSSYPQVDRESTCASLTPSGRTVSFTRTANDCGP
jgi:hypothetical protein